MQIARFHQRQNTETLSYGRRLNDKTSDYFVFAVLIIFRPLWNRLQKYIRTRQSNSRFITGSIISCRRFPRNKAFLFRQFAFIGILASLQLCRLAIGCPCQPDVSLAVSDPTTELSPAVIFATVYALRSHTARGVTLGISGWGCAAGSLEPLTVTRTSSAEFCYPILE